MEINKEINVILINANRTQSDYIESLLDPNKFYVKKFYEENPAFEYLANNNDLTKVVVVSYQLTQGNGINLIKNLKKQGKDYPFVFLSSDNTIERVVEAMQVGAMDFLSKTYGLAENLETVVERSYTTQIKVLERKDIEEKLAQKNRELAKLSVVASETSNIVAIFDSNLELEWVNKAFVEVYGFTKQEFIDKFGKFLPQQSRANDINRVLQECIIKKKSIFYTNISETKLGEQIWMQSCISPVVNEKGIIEKFVLIETDITEIKKAEKKIIMQQKKIEESLNYAERIQSSIFPTDEFISKYFKNYFILLLPRDKVSGDFPFFYEKNNKLFLASADCTGHGVPGAFLTFVGYSNLVNIIDSGIYSPSEILSQLDAKFEQMLKTDPSKKTTTLDGMEVGLCNIDFENKKIIFASAGHDLVFMRKDEVNVIKGIPRSISALKLRKVINPFKEEIIDYKKGDRIFLFSDGLQDQFKNNDPHKKFSFKKMIKFLEDNTSTPMRELHNELIKEIDDWKETGPQTDDILVMGFEF